MDWAQPFFQKYPELAVYLALGVGYAIGGVSCAASASVAAPAPIPQADLASTADWCFNPDVCGNSRGDDQ